MDCNSEEVISGKRGRASGGEEGGEGGKKGMREELRLREGGRQGNFGKHWGPKERVSEEKVLKYLVWLCIDRSKNAPVFSSISSLE